MHVVGRGYSFHFKFEATKDRMERVLKQIRTCAKYRQFIDDSTPAD